MTEQEKINAELEKKLNQAFDELKEAMFEIIEKSYYWGKLNGAFQGFFAGLVLSLGVYYVLHK